MLPADSPDRIGRYELHGLLARGGMGRLYLARDPNTGRLVIIKLMDATLDSAELRDRFDREARSLASLNHAAIIHIYDYGDYQASPFIAMEYVRGETMEEKIKRRAQMTVPQKLRLLGELCAGLGHAHSAGIIHRDVKPANLMVDLDDHLKILDFGIARVADSNLTRMVDPSGGMGPTQIGTLGYMSPEQTQGKPIDARTDVFAVGAVAYELLSGVPAFTGATARDLEASVLRAQPLPLTTRVQGLDPEIDAIVRTALSRDPNDRYKDAAALGLVFERCRTRLDPAGTQSAPRSAGSTSASPQASVRAGAAYVRAAAAYKEQALDLARRCALEALAEDTAHTGARALLTRLDQGRVAAGATRAASPAPPAPSPFWDSPSPSQPGPAFGGTMASPSSASLDPTVLIAAPKLPAQHAPVEPTVIIRRDQLPPLGGRPDETVSMPTPDLLRPTVAASSVPPPAPSPGGSKRKDSGGMLGALSGLFAGKKASAPSSSAPRAKKDFPVPPVVFMAVGAVLVAALLVWGGIVLSRSFFTSGLTLTVNKPAGGTLVGAGLECGTRGSDCSTTLESGASVEFQGVADTGYLFTGFTGDCAPSGRMMMTRAQTCGATFEQVSSGANTGGPSWTLTIAKPTGGTIVAAGGVLCGSLGANCSATIPDGAPVNLHVEPDSGFALVAYTGDCAPNGETTMSAARSCSATFAPTGAKAEPVSAPPALPRKGGTGVNVAIAQPAVPAPAPVAPAPAAEPTAPAAPIPTQQATKVEAAISPEEHARKEISDLVVSYCTELESLSPDRVDKLFHVRQDEFRNDVKQYRTLRCSTDVEKLKFPVLQINGAGGAGSAQAQFDMKQEIQMKSGGAPKVIETIVTAYLSRPSQRDAWLMDRVLHRPKPK